MKFYEAVNAAQQAVERGEGCAQSFQQWQCVHCRHKNTMAEANKFFIAGICDMCDHVTDMLTEGCSFAVVFTRQLRLPL